MSFITIEQVVEVLRKIADRLEENHPVEFKLSMLKKKRGSGLDLELWWARQDEQVPSESVERNVLVQLDDPVYDDDI